MGFFDVAARLCTGDGPIAALVAPLDRSCAATNTSKLLFRLRTREGALCVYGVGSLRP